MTTDNENICYGCRGHNKFKPKTYTNETGVITECVVPDEHCETVPVKGIATCPCIKCIVKIMCVETCLLYDTYVYLKHVSCYQQSY